MIVKSRSEIEDLRDSVIEKYFGNLNPMQRQAVLNISGPMLILAGAGSGKTTVLIERIANIVKFGRAYKSPELSDNITDSDIMEMESYINGQAEKLSNSLIRKLSVSPCPPWRILAITFTNKAANELKERLCSRLGDDGDRVMASTFHSFCARFLRQNAHLLGYDKNFTIYDSDDTQKAIKGIQKEMEIEEGILKIKQAMYGISKAKEKMISPQQMLEESGGDFRKEKIAKVYERYEQKLKNANAMDFDDLILNAVKILEDNPDVQEKYHNRYRYIMIDEYQDTNFIQYRLTTLLTNGENNLCVVGDDDQSIYKFRGATIENILGFEDSYPNTTVIRLEQNYRSTQNILNVANEIIKNNTTRKAKKLWTNNVRGVPVRIHTACNEQREAMFIVDKINDMIEQGKKYSDCAVLYRMNTQAPALEKVFIKSGIPYKKLSGHRLLDSEEIKDVVSYLSVLVNPNDNLRLRRILNKPKRAIGERTISAVERIAEELGISMFEVVGRAEEFAELEKSVLKLTRFHSMITRFINEKDNPDMSLADLYDDILVQTGYIESWQNSKDKKKEERIENVREFASSLVEFEMANPEDPSLENFLEEFSLIADIDDYNESEDKVVLMTMHSAKGLEFPVVFVPGFEDGVFPGVQALYDEEELEEERRLAYVAATRAKERLYLINSESRMIFGKTSRNKLSLFANEIPDEYIKRTKEKEWKKTGKDFSNIKSPREERMIYYNSAHDFNQHRKNQTENRFSAGDKVKHRVFGVGSVVSATPMGNDTMLEINFEKVGSKKIMANFAKLQAVE